MTPPGDMLVWVGEAHKPPPLDEELQAIKWLTAQKERLVFSRNSLIPIIQSQGISPKHMQL